MRTKEERKRCKKSHETTIGKIIYGFLLFLPLLAIGVTCGYAMFNKNAYQSFASTDVKYQQVDFENLNYGDNYLLEINNNTSWTGTITFYYSNLSYTDRDNNLITLDDYSAMNLYNGNSFSFRGDDVSTIYLSVSGISSIRLTWNGTSGNSSFVSNINFLKETQVNNTNIQDVFYYSVDRVTQSNLFNWSQNSIIYTGMSNFTTALSITNTFVPTLLTYWLIISIVYFMYDIVLMMLTILHRKIHELQDSI